MSPDQHQPSYDCNVCIVGGGPAGLTLAHALSRRGISIVLLESGDHSPRPAVRDLATTTTSGDPLHDLRDARPRALGGASTIWSTIRGGRLGAKYMPFDPIDFEQRDVTEWSGWPMTRADLEGWYDAARQQCGLSRIDSSVLADSGRHPLLPFPADGLTSTNYAWGSADNFTKDIPADLAESPHAMVICGATATRFIAAPGHERITSVHWKSLTGVSGRVQASHVVLAAGAIENARLLLVLASDSGRVAPYWLGRGFMEHPIDRSITLVSRHPALSPDPGFYAFEGVGSRERLIGRIGLSENLMREQKLRNASLRLFAVRHSAGQRTMRRFAHRLGRTPATVYRALLDLEQAPHPENRVTLSDQRDALGIPRAHLHWQWRGTDERNRQHLCLTIQREFARADAGEISIAKGQPIDPDVHHHAGTTRMHHDPSAGVVDANLRVHGYENLHITGASVFPTASVANPTLTVVALTLRLADHLAGG